MNKWTDQQLLRDYADHRSEGAFAELVRRHIDLVYSAALRMVCDADLAKDVSQNTFLALAQAAPKLVDRPVLSGWLHRSAQNLAAKVVRSDVRRHRREQEAAAMNQLLSAEPEAAWEHIVPHLDAALGELSEPDRDAVLLRYVERKSAQEMAEVLGVSAEAAQKRVSRAVERLREFFTNRGITVGVSGLVVVISANAVQAAPVGLAVTISAAALAGTAATTSTLIAATTKTIAMTALQKTLITATVAVLAGAGIYEARQASRLRGQVQTLQQQQAPLVDQIQQLRQERNNATNQLAALRAENDRLNRNTLELLKLRNEVAQLRNEKQQSSQSASETNDSAGAWTIGKIKWRPEWKDAGLNSPEAAIETYWWATLNGNVDRIKQSMVFDHGSNSVPVSDIFAKREARSESNWWKAAQTGGVRLSRVFQGGDNNDGSRADIEVEIMRPTIKAGQLIPVDPANPPQWTPSSKNTFNLVMVDGEWKMIADESRLKLTLDDEDSAAVADLLIKMPPEQIEELKSKALIPERTLRVYEELKAQVAK